jgi:hypothetical protein
MTSVTSRQPVLAVMLGEREVTQCRYSSWLQIKQMNADLAMAASSFHKEVR